jgi:hypothetical protein
VTHPGRSWRIRAHTLDGMEDLHIRSKDHPTREAMKGYETPKRAMVFDELVIDDWFHLEQMTRSDYWMRVGNYDLNVHIKGDGTVSVMVEDNG